MTRDEVAAIVRQVLIDVLTAAERPVPCFDESTHVLRELGLTSLDLVDVTVGLADGLRAGAFSLQPWLMSQARREGGGAFSVGSLVDACLTAGAGSYAELRVAPSPRPGPSAARSGALWSSWLLLALMITAVIAVGLVWLK